jgi:alanine racemase
MQSNLAIARSTIPGAKIWAVVKADAYGHGLENGLRGFAAADGLSLIEYDRAVRLRDLGWTKPIMMMQGMFDSADLDLISQYELQPVVHNVEQLDMLSKARLNSPIHVHLKINTGMNRLGFLPEQTREAYARLQAVPAIGKISLITHFANADKQSVSPDVATQVTAFQLATSNIQAEIR